MRYLVSFISLALISGCAFKQPEAKPETLVQQSSALPVKSQVTYNAVVPDTREGEAPSRVSGSTNLYKDSSTNQFRGEFALVLPAVAPDTLSLEARIVDGSLPGALRGELRLSDKLIREIPAAAFLVGGARGGSPLSITFALTEMKQYFAQDAQAELTLQLLAVDDQGKAAPFASLAISTPPSRMAATPYLPVEAFEKKMKVTVPDSIRHATTADGRQVELVGIFEVRNHEAAPIEITVPYQLSHTLDAVEIQSSVSTSECGHSVSKNPTSKRVASELWLLPLQASGNANGANLRIVPGEVGHVGVYAASATALTPAEDRMAPQTVPTRCMAHCQRGAEGDWSDVGKWGWDCYYCGGAPNNAGEVCYGCMRSHREWCRWQDWRDWKDYTTVATGVQYSFSLAPAADKDSASAQYQVKFLNQSVPGRARQFLTEAVSIKR